MILVIKAIDIYHSLTMKFRSNANYMLYRKCI